LHAHQGHLPLLQQRWRGLPELSAKLRHFGELAAHRVILHRLFYLTHQPQPPAAVKYLNLQGPVALTLHVHLLGYGAGPPISTSRKHCGE
jgi:hypothetical protein